MKGFVISPILLVSLILIVGVIIINFSDIDKRIAEGIGEEARVKKILAEINENKTSMETLILFNSSLAATKCSPCTDTIDLEKKLETETGLNPSLSVSSCNSIAKYFIVDFSYNFKSSIFDVSSDKTISISKNVTCNAIKKIYPSSTVTINSGCSGGIFSC